MRRKLASLAVIATLLTAGGSLVFADHVLETLQEAKWGPGSPALPAGAQVEVLSGNPATDSLYTLRLKFPANYSIAAHSHPMDEHVTVVSGTLYLGMGDKLDRSAGKALEVGGFGKMPANMNHFAYTKGETIIVLHGIGPLEVKYVNPADDPRNAPK